MNFEDKISIKANIYDDGYVEVGGDFYSVDNEGNAISDLKYEFHKRRYDSNGDPINASDSYYVYYSKCSILPNTKATHIVLNDGKKYVYAYEVYIPLNKAKYEFLPKQGDFVKIEKKDGTIIMEKEIQGFVTYKKRYLRLWL